MSAQRAGIPAESVDLRSDTVTRPTPEMRAVMMAAEVGDDVYEEDPSINQLEQEVAAVLGKEAAVFTPSGTMANQIGIMLHTHPGDSVIAEEGSHVFINEAGAAAALSGVQFDLIPLAERFSDEAVSSRYRSDGLHAAPSVLLAVENTHNRAAGRVLSAADVERITSHARRLGLRTHCDGARLWNAAVAAKQSERELARGFDTVSVCFSKGLGAPVGSAIAGSAETMKRARKLRKRLGGGMRQAGFLAAAALFGVRNRARLAEDHRRAAALAAGLRRMEVAHTVTVQVPEPITNMVYWRVDGIDGAKLAARLAERGVRMLHTGKGWLRAVTHLEITDAAIERALEAARAVCVEY